MQVKFGFYHAGDRESLEVLQEGKARFYLYFRIIPLLAMWKTD